MLAPTVQPACEPYAKRKCSVVVVDSRESTIAVGRPETTGRNMPSSLMVFGGLGIILHLLQNKAMILIGHYTCDIHRHVFRRDDSFSVRRNPVTIRRTVFPTSSCAIK